MTKQLLQKTTGALYAWTEDLAKRNDMVDYVPQAAAPAEPQPEPPVEVASAEEPSTEDEIKAMARAVLTKKAAK